MGFTKLDSGILQSSIMAENSDVFKVWIAFLASCNQDGIAEVSAIFISSVCHLPIDTVKKAIERLSLPDDTSRSLNDDGRRLRRIDGGYEVINYLKYREFTYSTSRKAINQRKYRNKKKQAVTSGNALPGVTKPGNISASASASASRKKKTSNTSDDSKKIPPTIEMVRDYCRERGNGIDPHKWYDHYESKDWMIGKNRMKNWKASVRTWEPPGFKPGKREDPQALPKTPVEERASPDEIRGVFKSINSIAGKMEI